MESDGVNPEAQPLQVIETAILVQLKRDIIKLLISKDIPRWMCIYVLDDLAHTLRNDTYFDNLNSVPGEDDE